MVVFDLISYFVESLPEVPYFCRTMPSRDSDEDSSNVKI